MNDYQQIERDRREFRELFDNLEKGIFPPEGTMCFQTGENTLTGRHAYPIWVIVKHSGDACYVISTDSSNPLTVWKKKYYR